MLTIKSVKDKKQEKEVDFETMMVYYIQRYC